MRAASEPFVVPGGPYFAKVPCELGARGRVLWITMRIITDGKKRI